MRTPLATGAAVRAPRSLPEVEAGGSPVVDNGHSPPATEADSSHLQASVRGRAARGSFWALLAYGASRLLGLVTNLFLARLLSPHEFGLVGFSMILIGAFTLLQDLGMPYAIVYYGERDADLRKMMGTALTISVAMATLLAVAAISVAPLLARINGEAETAALLGVLAVTLIVSSLASVQNAVLVKRLDFHLKFVPDVIPALAFAAVAVLLAMSGIGAWSLVLGYLVKSVTATVLLWWLTPIRVRPRFDREAARMLLSYGQHLLLSGMVGFAAANVDYFVIGSTLGTSELGLYTMAFLIGSLPSTALSQPITSVAFSAYSRLKDDRAGLLRTFEDVLALVVAASVCLGVGIIVCASAFVPALLGSRWDAAVQPLKILCVFGVFRSIEYVVVPVFRAIGRPAIVWKMSLIRLVCLVPSMYGIASQGIAYIALLQAAAAVASVVVFVVVLKRELGCSCRWVGDMVMPHLVGLAGATVLGLGFYALGWADDIDESMVHALILATALVMAYGASMVLMRPRLLDISRMIRG